MVEAQKHLERAIGKETAVAECGQKTFVGRLGLSSWAALTPYQGLCPVQELCSAYLSHWEAPPVSDTEVSVPSRWRGKPGIILWQDVFGSKWRYKNDDGITLGHRIPVCFVGKEIV